MDKFIRSTIQLVTIGVNCLGYCSVMTDSAVQAVALAVEGSPGAGEEEAEFVVAPLPPSRTVVPGVGLTPAVPAKAACGPLVDIPVRLGAKKRAMAVQGQAGASGTVGI